MLMIVFLAFATGAACGLARVRVWVLPPIMFVFLLVVFAIGSSMDFALGRITLDLFAAFIVMQVAYLIGAALSEMTLRHQQVALSPVQRAIADELRDYFLPPDDLPRQLGDKLAALQSRDSAVVIHCD
jgi:hypothetical protein